MRIVDLVVARVLRQLVADGRLILTAGSTVDELVTEVLARFAKAPASAQLGPYLVKVLVESKRVDELFADNEEILELFNEPIT